MPLSPTAGGAAACRFLHPRTGAPRGGCRRGPRGAVLGIRMRWRLGYHHAFGTRAPMAFGHYGYGGSGGWADPAVGLSVGFVTNRIGSLTTPLGDLNLFRLNRVVRRCLEEAGVAGSPAAP